MPPKLAKLDVFRKVEPEFTRGTTLGALLSLFGITIILTLFGLELREYLSPEIITTMQLDHTEKKGKDVEDFDIRINFNITMERIPCPYLALELHNIVGTHRTNITKNIQKFKIKTKGDVQETLEQVHDVEPKRVLIQDHDTLEIGDTKPTTLREDSFESFIKSHSVVMINFFAPWCVWCQRLHPIWEAAAHDFAQEFGLQRVGIAWVDCTSDDQVSLCHLNHVQAFPTIISFRGGDAHSHDQYHGDRTVASFREYVKEQLALAHIPDDQEQHEGKKAIRAAELQDYMDGDGTYQPAVEGCRMEGYVLAPKVPGALVFAPQMSDHSIDIRRINVTHIVHHLSFGDPYTEREIRILPPVVSEAMHLLQDEEFVSNKPNQTHEHFIKVVATTYTYLTYGTLELYKYTHYAAAFHSDETKLPTARMHFDIAPTKVVITEVRKPLFKFITSVFALCGGAFTVFQLLDMFLDTAHQTLKKKISLGKNS
jgi:thiol-disulfide isomerase/thioredoxin